MADSPNTPNVLTRTPAAFVALEEIVTELKNPAYIPAEFSTLGSRFHGEILGTFIQDFMAEVQAALVGGTVPGPATQAKATLASTDASVLPIAIISVADGECVSVDAEVWGKKAGGDWVHVRARSQVERHDAGNGLQVLDVELDTGPRYSADTTLSTANAGIFANAPTNQVYIWVVGEAATGIDWTALYTVRRIA